MRNKRILILCESAIMIALAFALSCAKLWKMPMGGSITLASMLPIMLLAVKYGARVGLPAAFLYSLTQFFQGLLEGDFAYAETLDVFIVEMLFDYIFPFTALALACVFGKKRVWHVFASMSLAVGVRLLCHYISGVTIWAQWAPYSPWLYSLAYNGSFLLPDLIICLAVAFLLLQKGYMRDELGIGQRKEIHND